MSDEKKRIRNGEMVNVTAGGKTLGCVLFFWPKGAAVHPDWKARVEAGHKVFDGWSSSRDRYLVEVVRKGAKGQALPSHFYAPMAGGLEKRNPKAGRRPAFAGEGA